MRYGPAMRRWPCKPRKQYAAEEVRRTHGIEVQIHVGLNSGEVVVRAIGNDLHMDYSAIGHTTHLAARMEQLAPPGSIRLTADTLRLVEGFMQVSALVPVPIKGLAEPWRSLSWSGPCPCGGAYRPRSSGGCHPLWGGSPSWRPCTRRWPALGAGEGQVVALLGEPGVGKSRLVYEFLHSHHTQGWLRLESSAGVLRQGHAYPPVLRPAQSLLSLSRTAMRCAPSRPKSPGRSLTLDTALQETVPAALALFEALPAHSPFPPLDPLQRRPPHARGAASTSRCAKVRCSRCSWSSNICTGSTVRRRPCSMC